MLNGKSVRDEMKKTNRQSISALSPTRDTFVLEMIWKRMKSEPKLK